MYYFLNKLFKIATKKSKLKKTLKLPITRTLWGEPMMAGGSHHKVQVMWEAFPCHNIFMK